MTDNEAIDRVILILTKARHKAYKASCETDEAISRGCYIKFISNFDETATSLRQFRKLLNSDDLIISNPTKDY